MEIRQERARVVAEEGGWRLRVIGLRVSGIQGLGLGV